MGKWIFDDFFSLIHVGLGVVAAKATKEGKAIIGIYTVYQLTETEPILNKLGDITEFAIGYAIGKELN